jgi:hypothetical protein
MKISKIAADKKNLKGGVGIVASLFIAYPPIFSVLVSLSPFSFPAYFAMSITSILLLAGYAPWGKWVFLRLQGVREGAVFLTLLLFSLQYTPSTSLGLLKMANFLYIIVVPICLLYLALILAGGINDELLDSVLLKNLIVGSIAFLMLFILFSREDTDGRYVMPGLDNPIWVSRYFGAGFVATFYWLMKEVTLRKFFFVGVLFLALLISGSKGPFLAGLITVFFVYFVAKKSGFGSVALFIFFCSILFFLSKFFTNSYVLETDFFSAYYRIDAFSSVLSSSSFWFGNGIGSYGPLIFNEEVDAYPHNLFAEVYFDLGVIGLCLIVWWVCILYKSSRGGLIDYLCLYFFINAMVSGDYSGNGVFFFCAFLACARNKESMRSGL